MSEEFNKSLYLSLRFLLKDVVRLVFRRNVIRNELDGVQGPCLVIANHECMLDFVNLAAAVKTPMRFVISDSFYHTMSFADPLMKKVGLIPKQQFELDLPALRKMKKVLSAGEILAMYPAGLMCEDGLSTPIPAATYKFLKFLGVDVYMARSYGSYFIMPKWSKGIRPGRVDLDIYKLFSGEELKSLSVSEIRERTRKALLFDAYQEQETLRIPYRGNDNLEGLEHVLYQCPNCGAEFSMEVQNKHSIRCKTCGYEQQADRFGFLHRTSEFGPEIRHVSEWNKQILASLRSSLEQSVILLEDETEIHMIDYSKHKYVPVGNGTITFCSDPANLSLRGTVNGEPVEIVVPVSQIPILPFSPGKRLEIQYKGKSYRCVLKHGYLAGKFINLIKTTHQMLEEAVEKAGI